jgi:predicted 3-demethylubiquinone-9 3-methyltransferase (glyoxalase superfamily)
MKNSIYPCLWFDDQAEEAAIFYTTVFKNSKIEHINRYTKEGFEIHGKPEGSVVSVHFMINGQPFTALNGGPIFQFSEAVSFVIDCETQEEIDYYWSNLTGGECGWLKDKFGVSWQVVPEVLYELLNNPSKAEKVTKAFLQMKKFDLEQLMSAAK